MARSAPGRFLSSLATRQYPGSSGYWSTAPTGVSGSANSGGYVPGLGYPGDAARARTDFESGRQPSPPFQNMGNRYGVTNTGTSGTESGYNPLAITKNPWLKDFVGGLQTDLNKASSAMPDFSRVLSEIQASRGGIGPAFDRYNASMNLDDYIGAQRGGDAEFRARTDALSGDVGALSNRYGDVLSDYERRGQGALDTELRNAEDFSNRLIPQAVQDAYSQVQKNAKLYDFASPGGYSSGLAGKIASESTRAALPFMLEGSRYTGNVLGKYQPFYGDVASRQSNKITGFDYPAASQMYDRYGNVIGHEKATAANIQQLQISVAREGVDAAIRRHVTDFQSAQMLAQAANLPVEVIMQRAQAAGTLGGMAPLYQYEGLQGPEAWMQSPTGYNNSLPGYPPSRYGPTGTTTGNGPNPASRYGTPGAVQENLPSWMAGWSPQQIDAHYQSQIRGSRPTPSIPFDPNAVSGGWGRVNGEYIGANADDWNNAMYGQVVTP